MRHAAWLAVASMLAAAPVAAQSLASRVNAVRDGTVQMSFPTRPGVCGDGRGSVWINDNDKGYRSGDRGFVCVTGPVRVSLGRADGQTVSIRKCVACRARSSSSDVEIGDVAPVEAAKYLIDLARHMGSRNADEAVSAAAFANAGDLSRDFQALVRDEDAALEARKQGLFWFGQSASATKDLVGLYDSIKPYTLREHFTFVLSQRHDDDAALTKLIDIARRDPDFQVRKQALFWLGQSGDPKAIKFFKDILSR